MPPNFACKRCSLKAPSRPPSTVTEMNRLSQAPKSIRAPRTTGFTPSPALFGPKGRATLLVHSPNMDFQRLSHERGTSATENVWACLVLRNTKGMHILIGCGTILVCIYTLAWAWTLGKRGNRAGAIWTVLLAASSTAVTLYYLIRHRFYP